MVMLLEVTTLYVQVKHVFLTITICNVPVLLSNHMEKNHHTFCVVFLTMGTNVQKVVKHYSSEKRKEKHIQVLDDKSSYI